MAITLNDITWGTATYGSGSDADDAFKLGYRVTNNNKTLTFYVATLHSVHDTNNKLTITINSTNELKDASVRIWTNGNSNSWSDTNIVELYTYDVGDETETVFSASLEGLEAIGATKKATVSGKIIHWTNVTHGSVSIMDNWDNSFKVIVTPGKAGTNNAVVKEFLAINVSEQGPSKNVLLKQASLNNYSLYENGSYSCNIAFNSLSDYVVDRDKDDFVPNNRNVSVELVTIGEQGDEVSFSKNFTGTDAPRQYTPPTDPGTPIITYNKNRPTKNATYTYTWAQAESRNQNSPVEGYRVRLYRYTSLTQDQNEGTVIQGLEIDSDGFLQRSAGTNNFIDWELTEDEAKKDKLSIKLIPQDIGLKPGDVIRLNLYAYVRRGGDGSPSDPNEYNPVNNGWNDTDFSGGGKYEANSKYYTGGIYSPSVTLQRAGTMHVKTADGWKEGQVFVKTASGWIEADSVYVKTASGWKESE